MATPFDKTPFSCICFRTFYFSEAMSLSDANPTRIMPLSISMEQIRGCKRIKFFRFSNFGGPARAGKVTLERGLLAHSISVSPENVLDGVIRRSSLETSARA